MSEFTPSTPETEDVLSDMEKELIEIKQVTSNDDEKFDIISPQQQDSMGTDSWKSYLNRERLLATWSPPQESPYSKYVKTRTINSVEFVGDRIAPRYSEEDKQSKEELSETVSRGEFELDQSTAIVLNSGGAHSAAMAVELAKQGLQPVIMFDSIPHSRSSNKSEQELAVLLYFSEEMNRIKDKGKIKSNAPPVFILDSDRNDPADSFLNRDEFAYTFKESDFPTPQELQQHGIKRIIYLDEADKKGNIALDSESFEKYFDLGPILKSYKQAGIQILYTGISPYHGPIGGGEEESEEEEEEED